MSDNLEGTWSLNVNDGETKTRVIADLSQPRIMMVGLRQSTRPVEAAVIFGTGPGDPGKQSRVLVGAGDEAVVEAKYVAVRVSSETNNNSVQGRFICGGLATG